MKLRTKILAVLALAGTMLLGGALTVSAYQYTPEKCSHHKYQQMDKNANMIGNYNTTFNKVGVNNPNANMCYLCGFECNHPLEYRVNLNESASNYYYENGKHYLKQTCTFCASGNRTGYAGLTNNGKALIDRTKGQSCKNTCKQNHDNTHTTECSVCGHSEKANCSFNITYKPYYLSKTKTYQYSDSHEIIYKCTVCKGGKVTIGVSEWTEAHKFNKKTKKCTKCGYKLIIPGNTSIKKAKQSGKPVTKTVKGGGYWQRTFVGNSPFSKYKWIPKYKSKTKYYPIAIRLKKAKNAAAYVVSTKKDFTGSTTQRFTKTSFTYKYVNKKNPRSVKLYINSVSKTGNYGKRLSVKVSLKN